MSLLMRESPKMVAKYGPIKLKYGTNHFQFNSYKFFSQSWSNNSHKKIQTFTYPLGEKMGLRITAGGTVDTV